MKVDCNFNKGLFLSRTGLEAMTYLPAIANRVHGSVNRNVMETIVEVRECISTDKMTTTTEGAVGAAK